MKPENDIEKKYKRIKAQNYARKQRFIQRKKELGYSHISSLWVQLDSTNTEILKEQLKNASTRQLSHVIDFLSHETNNNYKQEVEWPTKALLESELTKYIQLKQYSKTQESLNDLSIRLMKMGISTKSRKTNKKIKFSTGSLSRMIRKIEDEMFMSD